MQALTRLRKATIVALALLLPGTNAFAGIPVIDIGNIFQNTITAIESKVSSFQAVQQTVALAQQLAQLWAIYNNATKMYKSIGNAVDSVQNFKNRFSSTIASWRRPITWANLGNTLDRWGIRPTNEGSLGSINQTLAGYDHDITRFNYDLQAAPGALSRDRVMRNIVRGAKSRRLNDGPGDMGELDLSSSERVDAMNTAADYQRATLAKELVDNSGYRERELNALKTMEENVADHEADSLYLSQMQVQSQIDANRIMLRGQEQQAAVAMEVSVSNAALQEQMSYIAQRQNAEAALNAMRDY